MLKKKQTGPQWSRETEKLVDDDDDDDDDDNDDDDDDPMFFINWV